MEKWIKIKETNNRYEVNSDGVIRKCRETITRSNGRVYTAPGTALTPIENPYGYLKVRCRVSIGVVKNIYVHAIVGKYFVDGWFEGAQLNHRNGNKADNSSKNLEWVTCKQNIHHAWKTGLSSSKAHQRQVFIDDIKFDSITDAANFLGVDRNTVTSAIKRGYYKSQKHQVIFNGNIYGSIKEAADYHQINPKTIMKLGQVIPPTTHTINVH